MGVKSGGGHQISVGGATTTRVKNKGGNRLCVWPGTRPNCDTRVANMSQNFGAGEKFLSVSLRGVSRRTLVGSFGRSQHQVNLSDSGRSRPQCATVRSYLGVSTGRTPGVRIMMMPHIGGVLCSHVPAIASGRHGPERDRGEGAGVHEEAPVGVLGHPEVRVDVQLLDPAQRLVWGQGRARRPWGQVGWHRIAD